MAIAGLLVNMHFKCPAPDYLQARALVGERGAKETRDDAHDRLGDVTLQDGIRVLPVAGVVAHLGKGQKRYEHVMQSHWITLPTCGQHVATACRVDLHHRDTTAEHKAEKHSIDRIVW